MIKYIVKQIYKLYSALQYSRIISKLPASDVLDFRKYLF